MVSLKQNIENIDAREIQMNSLRRFNEHDFDEYKRTQGDNIESGLFKGVVLHYVAPRGLLILKKGQSNHRVVSDFIGAEMEKHTRKISYEELSPGGVYVYKYKERCYRVIVEKWNEELKKIIAFIIDIDRFHELNVDLDELYELPALTTVENIQPVCMYYPIYGIREMDLDMQQRVQALFDDRVVSIIPMYLNKNCEEPSVDILVLNEHQSYEWLSSVLHRKGCKYAGEKTPEHYSTEFMRHAYMACGEPDMLQFFNSADDESGMDSEDDADSQVEENSPMPQQEQIATFVTQGGFATAMRAMFDEFVQDKNIKRIVLLYQLVAEMTRDDSAMADLESEIKQVTYNNFDIVL
ncbi:unnamed protein product [Caenorhabditis bovis]|uniref:Tudor domain-containing protein n=1 Tax=Caenorhabditis bovis TaxID=2654633 RepID=A0A8S1F691_9PELO|nr:unnamed protein product [Caenorhabditis bovis]